MTTPLLLGVDIGTSDTKVLATTIDGAEIACTTATTRWSTRAGSWTETDPDQLFTAVLALAERAVSDAEQRIGPVQVHGIATTGLGEAGVLLDRRNRPAHNIIAWFDPRGGREFRQLGDAVVGQFRGRTGLPVSSLASVAKLAWMRGEGIELAHSTWLSVPEYIAFRLGGTPAAEFSLAARTGLVDQDTSAVWPEMVQALGANAGILPPLIRAGTPLGRAADSGRPRLPSALAGAVVTVAGHDHPVAAVGSGAVGPDVAFDSFGTAQVLLRTTPRTLDYGARERLALAGIDTVHHVLGDQRILVAGTKTGLLLRRTLDLLGMRDGSARDNLDAAALALAVDMAGITVAGANNDDGNLRIAVDTDTATPAGLWLAVLDHGNREVNSLLAIMAAEVGPFSRTVVAGGWTRMASVRRAKQDALPEVRFSSRGQAGAFGAALFAAHAVAVAEQLTARGDATANAIDHPTGPSDQFAAQFTDPRPATAAGRIPEESTA
jgi:sugar (pentulose or hexulose) kinase